MFQLVGLYFVDSFSAVLDCTLGVDGFSVVFEDLREEVQQGAGALEGLRHEHVRRTLHNTLHNIIKH